MIKYTKRQNAYKSRILVAILMRFLYNELNSKREGGIAMDVSNDVRVTIRVDRELKERAESLFNHLGMNMTTALNVFLRKAVDEEAIPFTINAKGNEFRYSDIQRRKLSLGEKTAQTEEHFQKAVADEIARNRANGYPIALYDIKSKRVYLEYADGRREYAQ
ncbi:MAG: type II toxin-antitoxin system RelB/DinJ family antitoxin [Oscillospiraceae bacterium]|nr:type II toxin-antitoxin system RelB/DinJ family antitoxin [Oscillospiraceae bacterium]